MQSYTLRDVQALLGVPRSVVNALISAGVIAPRRGERGQLQFSFQDIVLLRTAQSLRASHVSTRHITRALQRLDAVGAGRPATGVRIRAVGGEIAIRDEHGAWHIDTGQRILDFESDGSAGTVVEFAPRAGRKAPGSLSGIELFEIALELEPVDPAAAESAYHRALTAAPDLVDAWLNLGCLLCDQARFEEAAGLYREALGQFPDVPLVHYNLAVALEDAGQYREALAHYHESIKLAPDFADAHYNAARLHDKLGDTQRAIRHYNRYRQLGADK